MGDGLFGIRDLILSMSMVMVMMMTMSLESVMNMTWAFKRRVGNREYNIYQTNAFGIQNLRDDMK